MMITINANKNMKIEMRLMPCIYCIHFECGASGSRFLMYRYSASCRKKPMVNVYPNINSSALILFTKSETLYLLSLNEGGLAQLARALAWHARGRRFEPDILH